MPSRDDRRITGKTGYQLSPFIGLDPERREPLHRQLYEAVRAAIISGALSSGTRLPSTRTVAVESGVSRVTACAAFDQLRAEGYLVARHGSGTFVCDGLPEDSLNAGRSSVRRAAVRRPNIAIVSTAALAESRSDPRPGAPARTAAFRIGLPALDLFPAKVWARLTAKRWRGAVGAEALRLLDYGYALGYPPLRRALADYVSLSRGVRCGPDQVIVTTGAQQGIDLAARTLLRAGDKVWLEDPGYFGAREAFAAARASIVPVPVDADGLDVRAAEAFCPRARLVYVSPSHQFPLGVTMSMDRRLALLDWAARNDARIIEDDYDGEFRYVGRPLASLQGLDAQRVATNAEGIHEGRVLYVGTFSKTLFPSIRLGYIVVPESLIDAFSVVKAAADRHTTVVDQAVLADFIQEGHYTRHLRRMRLVYAERQATLIAAATEHLAEWLDIGPSPAGMHLVGWLRPALAAVGITDEEVVQRAAAEGVNVRAVSSYRANPHLSEGRQALHARDGLLFGYAGCSQSALRDGARRLGVAIADCVARRR